MASLAVTYHQSTISSIPICKSGSNSSSSSWRNKSSLKLDAPLRTSPTPLLFSSSSLKFLDNATKTQVDVDALATALEQCAATHDFQLGTQIHARIIYTGLAPDVYLSSKLLYFYSCIGDVNAARLVFDATPCVHLNLFFWNTMIRAYVNSDRYGDAIELFCEMEAMGSCPNEFTFPFVLKSCSVLGCVELGRQIHCLMVVSGYQHDVFAASALLDLYGKWGFLGDACELFNRIPQRSLVTLNSMLSGYAQNGCWLQALDVLELVEQSGDGIDVSSWNSIMAGCVRHGDGDLALETLRRMMASGPSVKPDSATFNTLLPVISSDASLVQLKELHGYTLKQQGLDSVSRDRLRSYIAAGYASHGCMGNASQLFNGVLLKSLQLWISMISGFIDCGEPEEAFCVFQDMVSQCGSLLEVVSKVPLTLLLPECSPSSRTGLEIHAHAYRVGLESNTSVTNALISMYARRGDREACEQIFFSIPEKDVISWNTMISMYSRMHDFDQAFSLFNQMHSENVNPDEFTFASALSGCGDLGALRQGAGLHGKIIKSGFSEGYCVVQNALVGMYGKCGCIKAARNAFDETTLTDEISWNTIISCYGVNARPNEVFSLFNKMQKQGWEPNHITFVSILSACSHAGLVDEALHFFHTMTNEYRIVPNVDHYACIVDTLGRAGQLDEAYRMIRSMPIKADDCVWGALLAGCRIHGDIPLAEVATKHLMALNPQNSGYHVLLSNIYRNALQWSEAMQVRAAMKDKGVKKFPGHSWVEVGGICHKFLNADKCHSEIMTIYFTLDGLTKQLKAEGYVPCMGLEISRQKSEEKSCY